MNEETNTPEPIAAILADFRKFALRAAEEDKMISPESVLLLADKAEAASKRERAITDIMLAVKDKPLPHHDPDNAPPLFFPMTKTQLQTLSDLVAIAHDEMDGLPHREQELERFDSLLFDMKARYAFDKPYAAPGNAAALREALERIVFGYWATRTRNSSELRLDRIARAALAAPARNCDRFEDGPDALDAYRGTLRDGEEVRS